jgi:hypothetical protein
MWNTNERQPARAATNLSLPTERSSPPRALGIRTSRCPRRTFSACSLPFYTLKCAAAGPCRSRAAYPNLATPCRRPPTQAEVRAPQSPAAVAPYPALDAGTVIAQLVSKQEEHSAGSMTPPLESLLRSMSLAAAPAGADDKPHTGPGEGACQPARCMRLCSGRGPRFAHVGLFGGCEGGRMPQSTQGEPMRYFREAGRCRGRGAVRSNHRPAADRCHAPSLLQAPPPAPPAAPAARPAPPRSRPRSTAVRWRFCRSRAP